LRSKNGFGVGEFADLKLLVDWAKNTGLKLIQLLPVNDTTATHTFTDSYPYASISAFALHPMYINLQKVAGKKHSSKIASLKKKQKQLNELPELNYTEVTKYKNEVLEELYELDGKECFDSEEYKDFFENNKHWLVPYAVFCYLRDKNETSHFQQWKTNGVYDKNEIGKLAAKKTKAYKSVALYYYVQFHLHLQLKEAADYASKNGVVLKGDIPIGVYRYGCDAWMAPELYHMDQQAGAPPDDFAVKGQNWGFPTYNWQKMQEDDFSWWQQRFQQMSNYFAAFRIDHILGFFRIWSIPMHAVEGGLGHFVPAIPVNIIEFSQKNIWFDYQRYCQPFITDEILSEIFGQLNEKVKSTFLIANDHDSYDLEMQFATQRQVARYFETVEPSDENAIIQQGLFDLISNVIFLEEENSQGTLFHFRIAMDNTSSFRYLDAGLKRQLKDLYINYFYQRQDDFWKKEAMHKLPYLKATTNMLICGEDLGMVPHPVPEVMKQLGILSLEIQRMPKDMRKEFFHPNDAPYLSVITPSTHDMSTIRGWWEEDRNKTQRFFNNELGQPGAAPFFCEAWINRAIILQHLYSPAMWSIFQLQDLLGMDETLRRNDPHEERINIPADPKHYWRYRMHITLEQLIKEKTFNLELQEYISNSGR
jgi:4-alpha-glucanotransferase